MGTPSFSLVWAPGYIGMAIGFALYGASIGQYLFYVRFFPDDHYILKFAVFTVLYVILKLSWTITTGSLYWKMLVICRQNTSYGYTLALPWQLNVTLVTNCMIAFCVQWCDASSMSYTSYPRCPMTAFMRTGFG
ncbi:hypothetical protein SCLCIDRAFT_1222139 [Scleroderma citrinum Foug A]|uniref:Uncharacterized protein n=1 Tax=Scleroderma citrinum Foug A TaxID=1036808 RepID=A0A0C2YXD8_9AGAM|nr:hypothetical protein SCLCIDRAFT_1222139 [Scleroderma citrinum Foug A]